MTEFDDLFLDGGGLAELQASLEDPGVARAAAEARVRTAMKNLGSEVYPDDYPLVDENTEELDELVGYLIGSHVRINGAVTIKNEDGEGRIVGDDMSAEFRGFVADVKGGKLEYKYFFQIAAMENPDGSLRALTKEEMTDESDEAALESNASVELAAASFDSVHLSFDILHPVQALAWLSIEYPEVVKQLDELILGSESDSAEQQLLKLKHFRFMLPEDTPASHLEMALQSIREYAFTLIAPDIKVAYGVLINGDVEKILEYGESKTVTYNNETSTLSLLSLMIQGVSVSTEYVQFKPMKEYGFVVHGILHPLDTDMPSEQVVIPLHSLEDMKSLRDLYLAAQGTGENT